MNFSGASRMSALGKVYGDFDSNGQLVETRGAGRVIERSDVRVHQ
jgi:hypothetical protein